MLGRREDSELLKLLHVIGLNNYILISTYKYMKLVILTEPCFEDVTSTAITSDGGYIYIHNKHGMFKFGTGYGGTLKVLLSNFVILRYQKFDQIRTIMLISKHMFLKCKLILVNIGKPHMTYL